MASGGGKLVTPERCDHRLGEWPGVTPLSVKNGPIIPRRYKYGGYIGQQGPSYVVYPPRTDYSRYHVSLPGVDFYPDSTAWYHNHPAGGEGFSRSFPQNYGDASQTISNFKLTGGRNATAYVISQQGKVYRMDASTDANGGIRLSPTIDVTTYGNGSDNTVGVPIAWTR